MDHGSAEMAACEMSMMWNWQTVNACFLASSWQVTNNGMMAASCIGVALLVVLLELIRCMCKWYDAIVMEQMRRRGEVLLADRVSKSSSASPDCCASGARSEKLPMPANIIDRLKGSSVNGGNSIVLRASALQQFIRAFLHAVAFGVAYIVMLIAMSFNGYIIISIIIGAGLGKFLTDWLSCTIRAHDSGAGTTTGIEDATVCCH
ncbi:Ctr copper transporter family-domain-containing protein [Plectosphaerella plurivora]|uniref:Copper transport protein n=1 Tax=Plectosphaerella plurivora TaxID=936078 RepID=A0A9P8V534_9PEZI|nr:Ctr copper transporter family-domain-containing protein [Plectosphaerella plurivora]